MHDSSQTHPLPSPPCPWFLTRNAPLFPFPAHIPPLPGVFERAAAAPFPVVTVHHVLRCCKNCVFWQHSAWIGLGQPSNSTQCEEVLSFLHPKSLASNWFLDDPGSHKRRRKTSSPLDHAAGEISENSLPDNFQLIGPTAIS